jgi:hypothetical protein
VRDRLMRDADIGVFRYNPDDETFHFSEALVKRGEAMPVYRLADIVKDLHQDDVEKDKQVRDRLTTEGGTGTLHLRRRKPDGTWRHTLAQFCVGPPQLPTGKFEIFGLSQNITELVDARDQASVMHDRLEIAMSGGERRRLRDRPALVRALDVAAVSGAGGSRGAGAACDACPFGMYHDDDIVRGARELGTLPALARASSRSMHGSIARMAASSGCACSCACSAMNTPFRCALSA